METTTNTSTSTQQQAPIKSTKVFVGNLAFKTTEVELGDSFRKFGTVVETKIITRGRRSLGYGFVDFENEDEAKKAVEGMDQQDLDGRPLNVELANPRDANTATNNNNNNNNNNDQGDEGYEDSQSRRGRRGFGGGYNGGFRPRGRGGFRGRGRGGYGFRGGFRGVRRGGRGGLRRGGRGGSRSGEHEKIPSTTTLFVANLPFSVDQAHLQKIFEGFDVKSARVVTTRSGKSRGYGFVSFGTEEEQIKAMKAVDNKEITAENGNRQISVKIALAEQENESSEGSGNNTNNVATTSTTSSTTTTPSTTNGGSEKKAEVKETAK